VRALLKLQYWCQLIYLTSRSYGRILIQSCLVCVLMHSAKKNKKWNTFTFRAPSLLSAYLGFEKRLDYTERKNRRSL
jgi:hypothetical protein